MCNAHCMHVYPHMSHSVCCVYVRVLCVCEGVVVCEGDVLQRGDL